MTPQPPPQRAISPSTCSCACKTFCWRSNRRSSIKWGLALVMAAASLGASMSSAWAADTYPLRPVKIIIPFPPGGTLDTVGRQLAQKLSEQTVQNFIVENRPGGNGVIGGDVAPMPPAHQHPWLLGVAAIRRSVGEDIGNAADRFTLRRA